MLFCDCGTESADLPSERRAERARAGLSERTQVTDMVLFVGKKMFGSFVIDNETRELLPLPPSLPPRACVREAAMEGGPVEGRAQLATSLYIFLTTRVTNRKTKIESTDTWIRKPMRHALWCTDHHYRLVCTKYKSRFCVFKRKSP